MSFTASISSGFSDSADATLPVRQASAPGRDQGSFAAVLSRQQNLLQYQPESEKVSQLRSRIRDVSVQYIAQSLVQPLLKQAREMRDDTPPFGATQAEKQFGALMDERTALDMVSRGRWGIVESVERRLLKAAGLSQQQQPTEVNRGMTEIQS
ncbi:MAG: hypothetical protein KGS45_10140 [Planctomycetes bacterium]|nr:hypothetical protein [Planctomycetota bacterium]